MYGINSKLYRENNILFGKVYFSLFYDTYSSEYGNTGAREPKLPKTENGSGKMKSREPLWLPYILGEQNSIYITTNDVKSLRNPIRTKTVYVQHCTGTQMARHT